MYWKSPFGIKNIKDGGGESESERKQRWNSLLSDLDEQCSGEQEQESRTVAQSQQAQPPSVAQAPAPANQEESFAFDGSNPGWMTSLYLQQLRGGAASYAGQSNATERLRNAEAAVPPPALPSTLPLREWIAHHSENESRKQTTHSKGTFMGQYKRMDKGYLEKSSRVALSLAKTLDAQYGPDSNAMVNFEAVIVDRVVVTNTNNGDADFVDTVSSLSESSTLNRSTRQSQRSAIFALGRIYYEMFTQGLLPSNTDEESVVDGSAASDSNPSSFDLALNISENQSQGDAESSKELKRPRRVSVEHLNSHYTTLQHAGLPPSLCRLVADMLENNDGGSGGLFRSDCSIASFSDVCCDLQQMVNDPDSFLHDSLLFRLEPVMPENLYGREDDLRACMEEAEAFRQRERFASACMVSGHSGCGKSSLVREVGRLVEEKGWRQLYCKFNPEVRPRPLSTIASAFDRFLADLVGSLGDAPQEVKASIVDTFENAGINLKSHHTFFQLIPTLRQLVPIKEVCQPNETSFNTQDADAAKRRLHRLFVLLTRALSSPSNPLLLCMDDLQWADTASLELIYALVEGIEDVNDEKKGEGGTGNMLLLGCFRSNEIVDCDPLSSCIQRMRDCHTIKLKEILLEGLTSDDVNALVSDSLFYPRRLLRSLSHLIHQKSAGNPLFVKEFLNSLATENLLTYSLSHHKWNFDEDLIQLKTVSEGVADLLTRRLQRLPEGVLSGLEVMTCIGSDVSSEVMLHVRNVCGNTDIIAALGCATKELLIETNPNGSYSFAHDVIHQTISQGIQQGRRVTMMKEIADTLIANTTETGRDAVLFIIVDLINRVGPKNTHDDKDRVLYATFNLAAGEKSIQLPDMNTAIIYLESGISFLDDYWKQNYSLSLALFNNASLALWALGKTGPMTKRINELLENARCFEDKLDSMYVMINSYVYGANSAEKGFALSVDVLAQLGESFPTADDANIKKELINTNQQLQELLPKSLESLPVMENKQKLQAMKFLNIAGSICYQLNSRYYALVSCRLVRLTMTYGLSEYSAVGLSNMAVSFASILQDPTEGYKLGKLARGLTKLSTANLEVHILVELVTLTMVNIWKEPIQCLLPPLLDCHRLAMRGGFVTTACSVAMFYIIRSFYSGSSLASLSKEAAIFLRLMLRLKRSSHAGVMATFATAMASLSGTKLDVEVCEDDENFLNKVFEKGEMTLAETIVIKSTATSFILRRMDTAERLVRQYTEFFKVHGSVRPYHIIQHSFYSGLVAFHFFRESPEKYWMDIGQRAIKMLKHWTEECKWNFENKLFLLEAEHHFAIGELEAANNCYSLSIASAKKHRFIHEEAISCELAGLFHLSSGKKDLSCELLKQSVACYKSWGATKKADYLLLSME